MKLLRIVPLIGLMAAPAAWAVYAPVPEQDQGKAWSVDLSAGVMHDSNIFGSSTGEISSAVYSLSPKAAFNASLTDQTFFSASYQLTYDHIANRPGSKNLVSHAATVRVAHAFTQKTTLDVSDAFSIQKNPEALLAGLPINSNQSLKSNEFNGSFSTDVSAKAGITFKVRSALFLYDDNRLGTNLDRTENIYGISGNYSALPELKLVGEYRMQEVSYRNAGGTKDKTSDYFLVGADYNVAKKVTASARLGYEYRDRDSERSEGTPYAEFSTKYDYAQGSYISAGYVYTLEETSNVALYTDTRVNRFFVNAQHAITALISASGSLSVEPSQLQGRIGNADIDETTTRLGVALSYLPTKNWMVSASYDYDKVNSDDAARTMDRDRVGLSARYSF